MLNAAIQNRDITFRNIYAPITQQSSLYTAETTGEASRNTQNTLIMEHTFSSQATWDIYKTNQLVKLQKKA